MPESEARQIQISASELCQEIGMKIEEKGRAVTVGGLHFPATFDQISRTLGGLKIFAAIALKAVTAARAEWDECHGREGVEGQAPQNNSAPLEVIALALVNYDCAQVDCPTLGSIEEFRSDQDARDYLRRAQAAVEALAAAGFAVTCVVMEKTDAGE